MKIILYLLCLFNRRSVEDNNILQFDCDEEEVDCSKQFVITAFSPIEDFNKHLENGLNPVIGIHIFTIFSLSYKYILYLLIYLLYDSKKL